MDNIIFLDIDGVLNGHEWCHMPAVPKINVKCIRVLNQLCLTCKARCVLISSWRGKLVKHNWPVEVAQWVLETHGFTGELCGVVDGTGHTPEDKRWAIERYVRANNTVKYVVIDDTPVQNFRIIRPNPAIGLEPYHITLAKEMLDGQHS